MAGGTLNGQVVYAKDASNYIGLGQATVNMPANIFFAGVVPDVAVVGTNVDDVTGWSTAVWAVIPFTPNFKIQPEISYGYASVANVHESAWVGGATFDYSPVTNLDFALDILYVQGQSNIPATATFPNSFDGWKGKLRIARSF